MKNIQVIDGARNATYDVFEATDDEFSVIFPGDTDIEFIEDLLDRIGQPAAEATLEPMWLRRLAKKEVMGIHGTLYYEMLFKKRFYPNKKESDADLPYSSFGAYP